MTNATKFAAALALILAAILVAAGGVNDNSLADAAALPFAKPGSETPVRATKGDRLDVHPEIRKIAGVTLVLRDFGSTIR